MQRKNNITIKRIARRCYPFLIVAEGVDLVYDLGRVFLKVVRPYVAPEDQTLEEALNHFVAYYEQSEMFDLYTHGTGPGLLGVIVNLLKSYLGPCVYSKLERNHTLDVTAPCPLTAYVDKLSKIVNMVVCEPKDGEVPAGKLPKMDEPVKKDEEKKKKKKKTNVKFSERKSSKTSETAAVVSSEEESDDSDAQIIGSSDEEEFTTLTSGDGRKQYRPPDKTRIDAKFGANKKKNSNPFKNLQDQLTKVSKKVTGYKSEINRLRNEISAHKKKLYAITKDSTSTATGVQPKVSSDGLIEKKSLQTYGEWEMTTAGFDPNFVNTQLRQDLESNSEEVQVIEDPDSTTGEGQKKKKKKSKRDREVEDVVHNNEDDEEEEDLAYAFLGKSQVASSTKRRRRISSDKSSAVDAGKCVESESDILVADTGEEKDWQTLMQEKDDVEEQLNKMKRKLEELMWDERARGYHDIVRVCVQRFHKAVMNNLGKRDDSPELEQVRADMERCTVTEASDGFKLGVCDNFIERIEKTVLAGEVPENKLNLTKTDNSVDNIVEGYVRDVTYELAVPVVVKQEKIEKTAEDKDDDDDDELQIVGYTEATIRPVDIHQVKREPPSPPPAFPKNLQENKEVSVDEDSGRGTAEKHVPVAADATPGTPQKEVSEAEHLTRGTPQKKQKKKVVSKPTEETVTDDKSGASSSQSTPQKGQKEVEATKMEQEIDTEDTQSPEKAEGSKAKRLKKTVDVSYRRVTRSSKAK